MAAVVTLHPETLRRLVSRASSDRHLKHRRTATREFKWSCASQRMRSAVLSRLAQADVELFALTVQKEGRRILADFVAGCVYGWHKQQDETYRLIQGKISAASVEQWQHVKARWTRRTK